MSSGEATQGAPFKPVDTRVRFSQLEEEMLRLWQERDIYRRSESERPADKTFVIYEGPPTANGAPGIHHVLARVFKDLIPRYKTMQGFRCPRKGGWDTHGLPVELEIEKELGLATKREIEEYGIARFNQRCRESVFRYVEDWRRLTERIGFWIDMDHPYVTCDNDYVESCWWIIKQLWDRGLVYQDMKGTPHCPRCVTSLSSHEVALGYQENTPDPSVFIKFQIDSGPLAPSGTLNQFYPNSQISNGPPTYFLAWTTTPWTLPGNTALAVNGPSQYALIEVDQNGQQERLVLASDLVGSVIREPYDLIGTVTGYGLTHHTYIPLYDPEAYDVEVLVFAAKGTWVVSSPGSFFTRVIAEDFVSLEDGTGIVHIAPAFGDEDLNAGRRNDLCFVQQVDLQGRITGTYPFAGKFVKDADEDVMRDLDARGLLYRREVIRHTYPFCWRCDTPLLYYAKASWYIRTTAVKERLVSGNEEINWHPEHIKRGRFGEWLRNNVDWAVSRERYWGTPLPIWQCQSCQEELCIGGVRELASHLRGGQVPQDLHRPYVDEVLLICPRCSNEMRRVPEVLDAWFDSGAMPLAQWHYPFEHQEKVDSGDFFPADYICEAMDQTRGWFYSLHALSVLLKDTPCYRNVICLGLILDAQGEKMSKSKGNAVDPWEVINAHGADAVRWYLFTATAPGNARRFSAELVSDAARRFLLPLWNVYAFFVTYANIDRFDPASARNAKPTAELDRWIRSELQTLTQDVTTLLENYNPTDAGRRIQEFTEALSNWYVRRSRRRFWKSENDADKLSAYTTLYTCLVTLSKLLAPFTPFLAEALYQNLVRSVDTTAPDSVHLDRWPEADPSQIDKQLAQETQFAMRIASLGRAARSKANVKVRQPLHRVLVRGRTPAEEEALLSHLRDQVQEELNVKEVARLEDETQVVEFKVQPNRALLGPKYGAALQRIAIALTQADAAQVARRVQGGNEVRLAGYTLLPEEVQVITQDRPGYAVVAEGGYLVAVETEITPELAQEGLARELVHRIQNMRRSAGFDIADRIITTYQGNPELEAVLSSFSDYVRQETLSEELIQGEPPSDAYAERLRVEGHEVVVGISRIQR